MSDPVGDRLRSYYRAIEVDPPARLTINVSRNLENPRPVRGFRSFWRPAFGAGIVAVVVIVGALVLRGVGPLPLPTPSGPVAASASPSGSPSGFPGPSESSQPSATPTPAATGTPNPTATPAPSPTPTLAPSPTPKATPTPAPTRAPAGFGATFSNSMGRNFYTATLLNDGRVLVAGGLGTGSGGPIGRLSTAQLWDPRTGKFTTTGSLSVPRYQHSATLLRNGKVLLVGGADMSDGYDDLASAELYDPETGKFTVTGSMAVGRARHTATLLSDGRVLIAGGANTLPLSEAEIYDPATGKFTATGSMTYSRERATATQLDDGRVLVAGGLGSATPGGVAQALASAELFNPSTGRFTATEPLNEARYDQAACLFHDPTRPEASYVMLAGGTGVSGKALSSAEVFNPAQGNFGSTPNPMSGTRALPAALELTPGMVLIVGTSGASATADSFDPLTAGFTGLGRSGSGTGQTATLIDNCRALLSGPGGNSWEIFTPSYCLPAT